MANAAELDALLEFVNGARGFDFSGYKRSSLERRLEKRLTAVKAGSYADYMDYLELHPKEFELLFDTLLINVTGFFRDPAAWEYLREEALPAMFAAKAEGEPVRVWCAACSTGEEAYSAAIVMHQMLGDERYRSDLKIYGTDLDEAALAQARQGAYAEKQVEGVSPELLDTYFEQRDGRHVFRPDLRRTVIFGRNDLVQDAPISRVDLLICRNVLIYFTAETQNRILDRLHFALREHGVLFVGRSELLIRHSERFQPTSVHQRIFTKGARSRSADAYAFIAGTGDEPEAHHDPTPVPAGAVLDVAPVAQLVVDPNGHVTMINRPARELFGLDRRDVGRPLHDLEVSYRPAELRGPIERCFEEGRAVQLGGVEHERPGLGSRLLDLMVTPILDGQQIAAASVTFADVTAQRGLQDEVQQVRRELGSAQEELQSTIEELETTNEELQSTNEELETTNEELQSTNEELETTNEELHSVNSELEATNEELRSRGEEVDQVNSFLETILTSMGLAVLVIDRELKIKVWNDQAEDLWGLRPDEVRGEHLMSLDIGLPVDQLRASLRDCLNGSDQVDPVEVAATNRRGKPVRCHVRCMPLNSTNGDQTGGVVIMIEATPG